MVRPTKQRQVRSIPEVTYYRPAGIPPGMTEEVQLSVEEMEAIRLKDVEGLEQAEGAQRMNVSRATFQRVLHSAHKKIAWGLTHGCALRIEGGAYQLSSCRLECKSGHCWTTATGNGGKSELCPVCGRPGVPISV